MPRRPNLESWLPEHPNSKGYWEGKVWMGYKANGKPDRRHVQRRTRAERNKAVRELERQREEGTQGRRPKARTVEQMLTRRFEVVLPQRGRAPRTIDDYWSKARNDIFPRWGGQRIDRLTPEHLEDGYAEMLAAGHAPGHVRKVHAILSSAFEEEVKRDNAPRNPCALVEPPALEQREMPSLSQAQARAVLAATVEQPNAARWAVGLAGGLRQGEVLGLRWPYVDFAAAELRVWWQIQRLTWRHGCDPRCKGKRGADCPDRRGGGLVFRDIKEKRRKTVPLPAEVVTLLRSHKAAQAQARLSAGPMWQDNALVFCQDDGRPIDPRADWEQWKGILVEAGVPHAGVHAMRHSTATLALHQGVGVAVAKELLGHSDIRVTGGYTHVSSPLAHAAAAAIGRALFGQE